MPGRQSEQVAGPRHLPLRQYLVSYRCSLTLPGWTINVAKRDQLLPPCHQIPAIVGGLAFPVLCSGGLDLLIYGGVTHARIWARTRTMEMVVLIWVLFVLCFGMATTYYPSQELTGSPFLTLMIWAQHLAMFRGEVRRIRGTRALGLQGSPRTWHNAVRAHSIRPADSHLEGISRCCLSPAPISNRVPRFGAQAEYFRDDSICAMNDCKTCHPGKF